MAAITVGFVAAVFASSEMLGQPVFCAARSRKGPSQTAGMSVPGSSRQVSGKLAFLTNDEHLPRALSERLQKVAYVYFLKAEKLPRSNSSITLKRFVSSKVNIAYDS